MIMDRGFPKAAKASSLKDSAEATMRGPETAKFPAVMGWDSLSHAALRSVTAAA